MKKFIRNFLLVSLLASSALAASEPLLVHAQMSKSPGTFAVSGILRSNANGVVIKLVQGVQRAGSQEEAVGAFTRDVLARYPGYSLVDTLVTSLPSQKSTCGTSI